MQLTNLLSEFWVYAHTKEYREGLFVEASGLVLDVLLLLVCVKLISYYLNRQSRSTTNFASSFFIAQFLREVLTLQLKSGGVAEINTTLKAALIKNELESLFSHFLYGNTENLIDLLRIRMRSGEHIAGHRTLTAVQRKYLSKEARILLERLDNLIVILGSLRQEDQCLRAYEFRIVLTAISDYFEDLSNNDIVPPPRTYAPMSTALASNVESWFKPCKNALDRQYNWQIRRSFARLLLSMPWMVSYRFIVRHWKRQIDHPYTDPFSSNFPQIFCNSLAQALGTKWCDLVNASGIDAKGLQLMRTQHRLLSQSEYIALLEKFRPHVNASVWNDVLVSSLTSDVDNTPISAVTVDAIRAGAIYYLGKLSIKDESSGSVVEQAFQNLWNIRPSST